jgi:hypothetical protein
MDDREPPLLSDEERRERHYRSMSLYDSSRLLAHIAIVFSFFGIVLWPFLLVSLSFLGASFFVMKKADRVSPYQSRKP